MINEIQDEIIDEFVDFDGDIVLHLPTIQEMMNAMKDPLFVDSKGDTNSTLARLCYMIKSIDGNSRLTSPEIKFTIQNKLSAADFFILKTSNVDTFFDTRNVLNFFI